MYGAVFLSLAMLVAGNVHAGDVSIEKVSFTRTGDDSWRVDAQLRHADTGWEHYADGWRVVDDQGRELGKRVLYHPHVDEQPFTRSLSGVRISASAQRVWVEAHDSVHGWSKDRVEVRLDEATGDRFTVRR